MHKKTGKTKTELERRAIPLEKHDPKAQAALEKKYEGKGESDRFMAESNMHIDLLYDEDQKPFWFQRGGSIWIDDCFECYRAQTVHH